MKRLLFFVALMSLSLVSWAQGDTVRYPDPWYAYHPHPDSLIYPRTIHEWSWDVGPWNMRTLVQQYNCTKLDTIYGVAVTLDTVFNQWSFTSSDSDDVLTAVLYEKTGCGPSYMVENNIINAHLVDSVSFHATGVHRTGSTVKRCFFDYNWTADTDRVQPCVEFYFDHPHSVFGSDTILVGYDWPAFRNEDLVRIRFGVFPMDVYYYNDGFDYVNFYQSESNAQNLEINATLIARPFIEFGGGMGMQEWGGIFPIVKLRCTRPPVLSIQEHTDHSQRVRWTEGSDGDYQLSLTTHGTDPADGLIVTTSGTDYTFDDLELDTIYKAWVRRSCRYTTDGYDTLVWSEWSQPRVFRVGVSGGGEGIDEPEPEDLRIAVGDGRIGVQGLAPGRTAEVCDMLGRRVALLPADGQTGPLPQGVYMVRVGPGSARKVVVLRRR